jgi:hypothetical protein
MIQMNHKLTLIAVVAGSLSLTACGGGGSSNDNTTTPYTGRAYVAGPLDAAQTPISSSVFAPLASATAGTPLSSVVTCGNQIVTFDTLDIVDAVATGLQTTATTQNPAAIATAAPQIQTQVTQLASDIQTLLGALGGGAGCSATNINPLGGGAPSGGAPSLPAGNPLAGTPLAPIGVALLPVLAQIQAAGAGGGGGGSGNDAQLTTLATTVGLLADALNRGLAQVPASARAAPVVGGVLMTVSTALTDLKNLLNVALAYQGPQTQAALETTLTHTLSNVLTQVVPVVFLETQAGTPGVYSSQINAAVASASHQLASGLGQVTTPVLQTGLRDSLAPALNPIENQVLPAILGPINSALASGTAGGGAPGVPSIPGLPPQLAGLAGQLSSVLTQLSSALPGGPGAACPLAGTPLAAGCALIP